jgi:hypothetical protein
VHELVSGADQVPLLRHVREAAPEVPAGQSPGSRSLTLKTCPLLPMHVTLQESNRGPQTPLLPMQTHGRLADPV